MCTVRDCKQKPFGSNFIIRAHTITCTDSLFSLSVAKSFDIQKKVTFHAGPNFTRTLLAYYLTSTYSEASSNPSNSKQNKDTDTTHKKINHLQHRTVKKIKKRQIKRKKNTEKSTRNSIPGEGNLLASGRHQMSR